MSNSISVSMHLGSGKNAINNMDKIKRADLHNNRKYKNNKNQEIDLSLSQYNITIVGTKNIVNDIKEFYKTEFGEALYNYNKKQQREDRKIIDYLEKMNNDTKSNIATEFIFQIGNAEDWENATMEDKQKTVEIFKKAIPILQEKNIKCFNASLHLDETSPHLHLLAVPVVEKQTRGLEKQVSQNKVITLKVLNDIRKEVEKAFIEEYNKIYGTNKELKKGCEITEHLQVQDYKDTKKIIEIAKKTADKQVLKEKIEKDYKKLTSEIKKANKIIDENNVILEDYRKIVDKQIEKGEELEAERRKKERENEEIKNKIEEQNTIKITQETILRKLEEEKKKKLKDLEDKNNMLLDRIETTENSINNKTNQLTELEKKEKDLENKNNMLLNRIETTENSINNKTNQLTELEKKEKDLENKNNMLLDKIENIENNINSKTSQLTELESEIKNLDNVNTEESEALAKVKVFKKTLFNLQKNDETVIYYKFKNVEVFKNGLSNMLENVSEFATSVKDFFRDIIKYNLTEAIEDDTVIETVNKSIPEDLKISMENFNNFYDEKTKEKVTDTIEEIKKNDFGKDF